MTFLLYHIVYSPNVHKQHICYISACSPAVALCTLVSLKNERFLTVLTKRVGVSKNTQPSKMKITS